MSLSFASLRARLLVSHLAVVAIGVAAFLVAAKSFAPTFVDRHIDEMGDSMMSSGMMADVRRGALTGLDQALVLAAVVSAVAAIAVAAIWSRRLLRPLEPIRRATRKLAAGSYGERVPPPREVELAALAHDVNALASALQETEQRRLRLIAEVSHELRTPLATIKGYMEGLVDEVFPPDNEVFVAVGREASRLERLALDLQELSRSEEGGPGLRRERSDLAELAREVATRLRPQFNDQGVRLDTPPGPAVWADVDRDRMIQVLTNIIGNALTHTPSGGTVTVAATHIAGNAAVTIADTGRGLTPDQLEAVFERFYRADRSLPGGSGIGLTIARSIARRHGGDITAASPGPGLGSTFTVTVPASGSA